MTLRTIDDNALEELRRERDRLHYQRQMAERERDLLDASHKAMASQLACIGSDYHDLRMAVRHLLTDAHRTTGITRADLIHEHLRRLDDLINKESRKKVTVTNVRLVA